MIYDIDTDNHIVIVNDNVIMIQCDNDNNEILAN